jgi:glutamyl-tRNA synthetase
MYNIVHTRVGPSPTGEPHIGTAYIALFNYIFAKKYNGIFTVRIEDTDRERYNKHSEFKILKFLKWINIYWNHGPDNINNNKNEELYRQSCRLKIYQKYIFKMVQKGFAYWCSCSKYKLTNMRLKQIRHNMPSKYNKCCLRKSRRKVLNEIIQSSECGVVRLNVPSIGHTEFFDIIRGKITIENFNIDDQILLKKRWISNISCS